jgi:RNA polymerase sigma-70 factor (ECF subfamily)
MAHDCEQTTTGDEQIIVATLSGDVAAFGVIVERYWNMVVALALSIIADRVEAEDIAQEAFLKAYSNLHTLKDPSRFAGWLSRIAVQECSNTLRKKRRSGAATVPLESLDAESALKANPGLSESQNRLVRQTVESLPQKFRTVVVMRFVGGLSAAQIARQLSKRPGTIRVWLHRAYSILRKELTGILEEAG